MKNIKIIQGIAVFGLLLFLGACNEPEAPTKIHEEKIPVKTWTIEKFQGILPLHGSGQFTTDDQTLLSFKTGGIIKEVLVSEGDYIEKGQVLATLNLTEINASVMQAELAYEKALRDHERLERLLADSVVTLEQFQNSKTALEMASQALKAVKFNREHSEIRAHRHGFVLRKLANSGQLTSAGAPVLEVSGAGKDNWNLKVALSDKDWAFVSEGDSAHIHTSVDPDRSYPAKVSRKARQADPLTGAYSVELKFTGKTPDHIASGMFGTAEVFSSRPASAWNIPYEALLDANGGNGFVFVTEDGNKARKIPVKVGSIFPDQVQILEGLESYSNLIISGSAYLKDNSSILIQD